MRSLVYSAFCIAAETLRLYSLNLLQCSLMLFVTFTLFYWVVFSHLLFFCMSQWIFCHPICIEYSMKLWFDIWVWSFELFLQWNKYILWIVRRSCISDKRVLWKAMNMLNLSRISLGIHNVSEKAHFYYRKVQIISTGFYVAEWVYYFNFSLHQ